MTRSPYRTVLYALLIAGVYAGLVVSLAAHDYWRSLGYGFVLCAFLAVRDDLTKAGAP